ncbi:MAG: cupin domain-containing protein [Nitrospiraceae bacterium]
MKTLMLSFILMSTAITLPPVMAAGQDLHDASQRPHASMPKELAGAPEKDWKSIAIELPPGGVDSWQLRPEGELLYVLEGAGRLELDGKPAMALNPGTVARLDGVPRHLVKNTSRTKILKILVVFIQHKGQPHPLLAERTAQGGRDAAGGPLAMDGDPGVHDRAQHAPVGLIF